MTQDEILEALHKVVRENTHHTTWTVSTPHLVLLVNLAIKKEREVCAEICEARARDDRVSNHRRVDAALLAERIRARGQA
jgi:hypothetical protein